MNPVETTPQSARSSRIGQAVLAVSGMGYPLTQFAIRRLGRRGALIVEATCGGLLIRDAAMIADGAPGRLRRGPAVLLWLEACTAGVAVIAGLRLLFDPDARRRAARPRPDRLEAVRRAAIGTLFGLHTVRFRIYLQPDHSAPAVITPPSIDGTAGPAPMRSSAAERLGLFVGRSLDKRLTRFGVWIYRRTKGGITRPWKVDALILTTRGRHSGRERPVVLQFFPDGEAMMLAAANDGGATHPGWYFNLTADPVARVEVFGRTIPVRADVLSPAEGAEWWERIVRRAPGYVRYARATTRTIPIVRLVPIRDAAPLA